MSEHAVGFLVSALIHLGLLWTLLVWLGMRTPQLPASRPVALTLAMFQDATASPATLPPAVDTIRPAPENVHAETPPPRKPPETARDIPVQPQPATVQQTGPEPRQARVKHEPVNLAPPVKPRANPNPPPEPKQRRATPKPPRTTAKAAEKPSEAAVTKPAATVKPRSPASTVATAAVAETTAAADLVPSLPPAEMAAMELHYLDNVRQRIAEKRFYPRRARRMGHQGTVMLRLVLLPDGSIDKVSLAESSGTQTLDEAALAAVRRVGRFPPFPQGLQREDWVVTVPLRYSVM